MKHAVLLVTGLAVALATASDARAQAQAQAPNAVVRDGFTAGGSLGLGGHTIEGYDMSNDGGGVVYELHLGGMLTPNLALLVEGFGTLGDCEGCNDGEEVLTGGIIAAGQYWISSKLWVKGGYGSGRMGVRQDERFLDGPFKGRALVAAVGLELLQRHSHAMDLQVRGMFGKYRDGELRSTALAAMIGFHFY